MAKQQTSKEQSTAAVAAMKKGPRDGVYRYTRDLDRAIQLAEREHIHNMSEIKTCQRELRHTIHSLALDKKAVSHGELILDLNKKNYFLKGLTERPKLKRGKGREENDFDQFSVRSFPVSLSTVSLPSLPSEHIGEHAGGMEEKRGIELKLPPPGKGVLSAQDSFMGREETTTDGEQIVKPRDYRPRSASLPAIFDNRPVLSRKTSGEVTVITTNEPQRRYSSMSSQLVPRPATNLSRNRSLGAKSDVSVKVQQKLEALKWKYSEENLERMKQLQDEREAAKEAAAIQEAAELVEKTEDETNDTGPSLSDLFDDLRNCRYLRPRKYKQ